jgi:hypothetical protein
MQGEEIPPRAPGIHLIDALIVVWNYLLWQGG